MNAQFHALKAELLKNKYASILWGTFIAFGLAPVMGGVFMVMLKNPDAMAQSGSLSAKMQVMEVAVSWDSYLSVLTQAMGVGGIMVFGFVASWIFGREYSDGTAKDLMALPVSRTLILNAKFIVYIMWCSALGVSNLLIGMLIGIFLQLPAVEAGIISPHLSNYGITTALAIALGPPVAFFALWGKGYLTPLGFVALTLVFAQVIGATGYGYYFPWSVPGLFSGAGGEYKAQLDGLSYAMPALTGAMGYLAAVLYWRYADHVK